MQKQAIKNWMVGRSGNEARVKTHGGLVNRKFKLNVGKIIIKRTILGTIKHSKLLHHKSVSNLHIFLGCMLAMHALSFSKNRSKNRQKEEICSLGPTSNPDPRGGRM